MCILMMIRPGGGGVASKNKETKKKIDDGSITGNNYRHYNTW